MVPRLFSAPLNGAHPFNKIFDPMASPAASGAGSTQRGAPSVPEPLQIFIPLRKADAARRLIYGYATAELPDKSGEICDYANTKPFYERWSADCAKASGGKSLGNLRAMHGKIAAGKISSIAFNDDAKRIEIAAKIVDDDEWRKIEEGVYTGFSQGGAYVKRWPDPDQPEFTRYTASPTEISLVDLPCLAEAGFELVKADGVSVRRAFIEPVAKAQAAPDAVASALRDWLAGNVTSDAEAAETIADFFDALQHDLDADPAPVPTGEAFINDSNFVVVAK
jgi:hypothetical protein